MSAPHFSATVEHFAARLDAEHAALAALWLERLDQVLAVDKREVFPSHLLLDHIPELIQEVAVYLRAPQEEDILANTAVMTKAAELGWLRFDQRASVHQVLREYQILCEILDTFFLREAEALGSPGEAAAAVLALSRAQRAVRVLQQQTVDAFIARYVAKIEAQTARLRNFSRLVSHEIRQPLGVLQVVARVLPAAGDEPEATRLVGTLERNVVRLAEVATTLERLAELSPRPEDMPNEQDVDLVRVGRDVAHQLEDMAAARDVRVVIDADLPHVRADAGRVELVLVNLIANAVKYSDPSKPDRLVHVAADRDVPYPCIRIRDNGIGIPQSKRDEIFEQFVRVHAHLDDQLGTHGMGLGLSIVRECMEAMAGTVAVESVEGTGTSFVLGWPGETLRT
jgi:signal transduction histidine kinase